MIKTILFDVGGTLIHLDRRFVIRTLNEMGVPASEDDFFRAHSAGVREISRIMRSPDPGTDASRWQSYVSTVMHELDVGDDAALSVIDAIAGKHKEGKLWSLVEPGTAETLQALKDEGYRLGVISNADGRIEQFLKDAGLAHYFEEIVDSELVGVEKPNPRIFEIACQRLNADPKETVYVGDIYDIDIVGANAAGIEGILLFKGTPEREWNCKIIPTLHALRSTLYA